MTKINWYPGHMVKTKRKIAENIKYIDVVLELIDARIPYSSKIKDLEKLFENKKRIIIMTKYDLCDPVKTNEWIKYYQQKGYQVLVLDLKNDKLKDLFDLIEKLNQAKKAYRDSKNMLQSRWRVLIMGVPNVGKSTLINRLVKKRAVKVGNRPGVTTSLDWIRINQQLELLDTPGILWPNFTNESEAYNLAVFSAIKEEVLPLDDVVIYALEILKNNYPDILKERYNLSFIADDINDLLAQIGQNRGCLIKGGEIDYDKVFKIVFNDLKQGSIKGITFDEIKE